MNATNSTPAADTPENSATARDNRSASEVLAGRVRYDDVSEAAQALVRACWGEQLEDVAGGVDLRPMLETIGLPWVEADGEGGTTVRHPQS